MVHLDARSGTSERGPFVEQSPFTADHELIQALEKRSQPIFCSEDCVLFCQGDPASGLYILRSGAAILTLKSESGGVAMCFEAGAGSLLGLPAIIGNVPYSLAATAQQGSIVRYVTREDFEDLIRVEPSLAISVFQVVAAEVVAARKALSEMRLRIETQLIPQNLLA
jgi:CRP-like cAMP-binding protein